MDIIKAVTAIILREMTRESREMGTITHRYGHRLFTMYRKDGHYGYIVGHKTVSKELFQGFLEAETRKLIR